MPKIANKPSKKLLVIDSTLRDGSHAIAHQFTKSTIKTYAREAEKAGVEILMVGHGNGLGASSIQLGRSLLSDDVMLKTAKKELKKTQLGAFLIPGFGTIKDSINPALKAGIDVLMVANHCTEANVTIQHLRYAAAQGLRTFGVLMMSHMGSAQELLKQAKIMEDCGVEGVLLMDSAGAYLPNDVTEKVGVLVKGLKTQVGFHAHDNLSMAVMNSVAAVEAGATIIDTTSRGMGAGAGNCQLEVFVAVIEKMGYKTGLNLYTLMDMSENIIANIMTKPQIIDSIGLTSGLAGVFSGFGRHAATAAKRFGVDARDILNELGKRKIIAGQEGVIIDVAIFLKKKKRGIKKS